MKFVHDRSWPDRLAWLRHWAGKTPPRFSPTVASGKTPAATVLFGVMRVGHEVAAFQERRDLRWRQGLTCRRFGHEFIVLPPRTSNGS